MMHRNAAWPPILLIIRLPHIRSAGKVRRANRASVGNGRFWASMSGRRKTARRRRGPRLLVAMGGSDPTALTLRCAGALARLDPTFRARFVIGPGMSEAERSARAVVALSPDFETVEGADDLSTEYAAADAALAAFGVTAYELASFGVPSIYLCLTNDHAASAASFEKAGMGISLGVADAVKDTRQLRARSVHCSAMRRAGVKCARRV